MPRQPDDTVQISLRIKERERLQLVAAAEDHRTTLNAEIAARLERSFEQRTLLSLRQMHDDLEAWLVPLFEQRHERPHLDALIQASRELLDCKPLPKGAKAEQAIGEIRAALRMIELMRRRPRPPAFPGSD